MTSQPDKPRAVLRIIDASLNRIGEGLRFLEEIARFILNDRKLTQDLKDLRHSLKNASGFSQHLVSARDAAGDVGVGLPVNEGKEHADLISAVRANSRRVQESLRTVEELARLKHIEVQLDPTQYEKARFACYTIEKELIARLLAQQ